MSGQQHAPAALYPQERPGTHFTGGWVGTITIVLHNCIIFFLNVCRACHIITMYKSSYFSMSENSSVNIKLGD